MKILTITLLLISQAASAQWYVGGKASVAFSNYKSKTPWKEVSNSGPAMSITAFKQVKPNYGIQAQIEYIQKGYYHKVCNEISDELNASYLEIPLMLDYSIFIPGIKDVRLHANVGFYTAWWLSGKYKTKGFDAQQETFDFKKNKASRFDLGPSGGSKIEYILKNGTVSLDFRYELGLIDLQNKINDNTSNTNRSMIIGISYMRLVDHF